jgi:hypothetical protein
MGGEYQVVVYGEKRLECGYTVVVGCRSNKPVFVLRGVQDVPQATLYGLPRGPDEAARMLAALRDQHMSHDQIETKRGRLPAK